MRGLESDWGRDAYEVGADCTLAVFDDFVFLFVMGIGATGARLIWEVIMSSKDVANGFVSINMKSLNKYATNLMIHWKVNSEDYLFCNHYDGEHILIYGRGLECRMNEEI